MILNDVSCLVRSAISPAYRHFIHTTASCRLKNYYNILSVPRNATQQQIKTAYYAKAKAYHPDANKDSPGALKFQEVSEAYEILSDEPKRRAYDKSISIQGFNSERPFAGSIYQNNPEPRKPMKTTSETLSKNHLEYVYKTLNRAEEEPKFRPFEDHCYPGTDFNRFEYARHWNPETKKWIYIKKATAAVYRENMQRKMSKVNLVVALAMMGTIGFRILM